MNLDAITVVLVGTTHAGNIGATARAMANMGLSQLRLVAPRATVDDQARARAAGADAILDGITVHGDLAAALADHVFVVGTSARRRESRRILLEPVAAASLLQDHVDAGQRVAVVFGRESNGLSNAELDLCDALVSIPVNEAFPSLNLAAAVTVIGYEIRRRYLQAVDGTTPVEAATEIPASVGEREHFFAHLLDVLTRLQFVKAHGAEKLMRKIRHLYMKAQPGSEELAILRGILSAVEESLDKKDQ